MRVLITGARGMLGADVGKHFAECGHCVTRATRSDFDLTDYTATERFVLSAGPDLVIHTAAYTDVDGCERDPDRAFRNNALASQSIALACANSGAKLAAVSTDFVFDGEKSAPYHEYDSTHPLSVYGESKLAGEALVSRWCSSHFIVRTSWLFGTNGPCFPSKLLDAAATKDVLSVVSDQVGTPTFTRDLAAAIEDIASTCPYGVYHVANDGVCSRFEFAKEIISLAGLSRIVEPIDSSAWKSPARRPKNSALRSLVREALRRPQMRPWQEALESYMAERSRSAATQDTSAG